MYGRGLSTMSLLQLSPVISHLEFWAAFWLALASRCLSSLSSFTLSPAATLSPVTDLVHIWLGPALLHATTYSRLLLSTSVSLYLKWASATPTRFFMQSANLLLLFNQRVLISLCLKGLLKRQDLLLPLSHFLTVCLTRFLSLNSSLTAFHGIGLIFFL